jgi:hypothetical protein
MAPGWRYGTLEAGSLTEEELNDLITQVDALRARRVLDHILEHGQVSTEELREIYGYEHAPRAARDVREWGIPLKTVRVRGRNGRSIGAYVLGDPKDAVAFKRGGRVLPPKKVKEELLQTQGNRCALCNAQLPPGDLQVDHRIPYEVAGESADDDDEPYQLVCASCNRKKSWACEHCPNWIVKDVEVCRTCMWASPRAYDHIATEKRRSVTLTWGEDSAAFDALEELAKAAGQPLDDFVKGFLEKNLDGGDPK